MKLKRKLNKKYKFLVVITISNKYAGQFEAEEKAIQNKFLAPSLLSRLQ
jgi:hypothetical protein